MGPAEPGRATRMLSRIIALLVPIGFLVFGILTLDHHGTTWDERYSYNAGVKNLAMIEEVWRGGPMKDWRHRLPGYQFIFDTARVLFAERSHVLFFRSDHPTDAELRLGFHLFNLVLSSSVLWLLFLIVREITSDRRLAVLASLSLALLPKFLAHSQNNPKDSVGLFCFTLAILLVVRASSRPLRSSLLAGVGVGLALGNHVIGTMVVPIALLWLFLAGEGSWRRRAGRSIVMGAMAAPVFLLCWPWLWADPWARALEAVGIVSAFSPPELDVLYLGEIYRHADPPWHYSLVLLWASTPLILQAGVLASLPLALRRDGVARVVRLAVLWSGALIGADLLAPAHYDGVRHLLPVLPALAVLAGTGLAWLSAQARVAAPLRSALLVAALVAGSVELLVDLVRWHPYHDAYLNSVARGLLGDEPERTFELEIWGTAYKEGAEWLAARRNSVSVVVPIAPHTARPYMDGVRWVVPAGTEADPPYLMFITRVTMYPPLVRDAQARLEPLFQIRRGRATLLEIYRLDATAVQQFGASGPQSPR